jgi:hypothetical protein
MLAGRRRGGIIENTTQGDDPTALGRSRGDGGTELLQTANSPRPAPRCPVRFAQRFSDEMFRDTRRTRGLSRRPQKKKAPSRRFSVDAIAAASPSVDASSEAVLPTATGNVLRIKKRPPPPDYCLSPVGRRNVAYPQVGPHAIVVGRWLAPPCMLTLRGRHVDHVPATLTPRFVFATP